MYVTSSFKQNLEKKSWSSTPSIHAPIFIYGQLFNAKFFFQGAIIYWYQDFIIIIVPRKRQGPQGFLADVLNWSPVKSNSSFGGDGMRAYNRHQATNDKGTSTPVDL